MSAVRVREVYKRPWAAVCVALLGVALSTFLGSIASAVAGDGPLRTAVVALAVTLPLIAAVLLVPFLTASVRMRVALGIARLRWGDVTIGLCGGLVMRAVVELIAPTTQTLYAPLAGGVLLSLIVAIIVSPAVEELLFRGVLQRALSDGLRPLGGAVAVPVSILLSTTAFTAAHITTGTVQLGTLASLLVIGVGCGLLTALTRRLVGAIAAHTVYNALGVVLLLW